MMEPRVWFSLVTTATEPGFPSNTGRLAMITKPRKRQCGVPDFLTAIEKLSRAVFGQASMSCPSENAPKTGLCHSRQADHVERRAYHSLVAAA